MNIGGYTKKAPGKFLAFLAALSLCCTMFWGGSAAVLCYAGNTESRMEETGAQAEKEEGAEEAGGQTEAEEKEKTEGSEDRIQPVWEGDRIYCTAFGDSIAKGYGGKGQEDLRSYTQLIADSMSEETGLPAECEKFAKNGLDSSRLNSEILTMDEALASLDRADMITLTIGANDLMQEFKKAAQEVLGTDRKFASVYDAFDAMQEGVENNPLLIVRILDVLNNWDYGIFEEQWKAAMETITEHRKDTAQLIVTNIYNPVSRFELPGAMNGIVEDIICNMNQIMYEYAEEYDYRVVNLFGSEICDHTQEDGLHPDQEGQKLIADLAAEKIDTGRFKGEPEKEMKEEPRPEKVKPRKYSLWTVLGPLPWIALAVFVCVTAVVLFWVIKKRNINLYRKRNKNKVKND